MKKELETVMNFALIGACGYMAAEAIRRKEYGALGYLGAAAGLVIAAQICDMIDERNARKFVPSIVILNKPEEEKKDEIKKDLS